MKVYEGSVYLKKQWNDLKVFILNEETWIDLGAHIFKIIFIIALSILLLVSEKESSVECLLLK